MVAKNKQSNLDYNEDTRIALLEQTITYINQTLWRMEQRFDQLDLKIDKIEAKPLTVAVRIFCAYTVAVRICAYIERLNAIAVFT